MALAEERTSLSAPARSTPPDDSGTPRSRRGGRSPESRLARSVAELRAAEDLIQMHLAAAGRWLRALESRRVHEASGYATPAELEERLLAAAPLVKALWPLSASRPKARLHVVGSKRAPESRSRSPKALTAVAQTMDRLRTLESEVYDAAVTARDALAVVERERVYEECGYDSYEEFLDRALGPSPFLAAVVGLVVNEPARAVREASIPGPALVPDAPPGDDLPSVMMLGASEPEPSPAPPGVFAGPEEAHPELASGPPPAPRRTLGIVVFQVVVCATAAILGAAAGSWGNNHEAASHADGAGEGDHAPAAPPPRSSGAPGVGRSTAASNGPAARSVVSPGSAGSAVRAPRPAGAREAHRQP